VKARATVSAPVKTILALIAMLASAGQGATALAGEPPAPASPEAIVAYHDSGEWSADTTRAANRAARVVRRRADDFARPAMVLDVDDTSLSSYECLKAVDFDRSAVDCADGGDLPAVPQTLELYRFARERGVTVFFITGRREEARSVTRSNLREAGYTGRLRLRLRPDDQPRRLRDGWKARTRRAIQRRGFRIIVNVGDQHSDLDGGRALRRVKLPNPMYVIATA
jgi:predicted secreted acid phosphatase